MENSDFWQYLPNLPPSGNPAVERCCDRGKFPMGGMRNRGVTRGAQFPGRRKVPTMSQALFQYGTFASARPLIWAWGRQTCFSPRAPSNVVTPLIRNETTVFGCCCKMWDQGWCEKSRKQSGSVSGTGGCERAFYSALDAYLWSAPLSQMLLL